MPVGNAWLDTVGVALGGAGVIVGSTELVDAGPGVEVGGIMAIGAGVLTTFVTGPPPGGAAVAEVIAVRDGIAVGVSTGPCDADSVGRGSSVTGTAVGDEISSGAVAAGVVGPAISPFSCRRAPGAT